MMDRANLFEFIKERVSILQVVGEHVSLKRAGNYWKGRCPFHDEKTGSFTVSPHSSIFYCFGCHVGGDVVSFIEKIENCTAFEAVKYLGDHYNITLPETVKMETTVSVDEKKRYFALCEIVAQWCHEQLKKNDVALQYILNRGFTKSSLDHFEVGYFPGGHGVMKDLCKRISEHNYLIKDLLTVHIVEEAKNALYSPFEERIIFPIKDHMGRFCGFGGRIFKKGDERCKYYNSRENSFFQKGSLLFGFDCAKKEMQKTGMAFLVEGYTDCISMVQHGIINTIATLGTACTIEHLKALSYHINTLYVVYDGDAAGHNAMLRLTELCWQVDMELKVVSLQAGHDPASFLEVGGDIKALAQSADDIFTFFLKAKSDNFTGLSLSDKLTVMRHFLGIIKHLQDPLKQDLLLNQAAAAFSVPLSSLKNEMNRLPSISAGHNEKKSELERASIEHDLSWNLSSVEKKVLSAILNDWNIIKKAEIALLIPYMPEPMRCLVEKIEQVLGDKTQVVGSFSYLFSLFSPVEKREISGIMLNSEQVQVDEVSMIDLVASLEKQYWKIIVQDVKCKIEEAQKENDAQKVQELVTSFLRLKQKVLGKGF